MHHFHYKGAELFCEDVPVRDVVEEVGTPVFIYSHATLRHHFRTFDGAFSGMKHLICFSMKSNSNLAVLRLFAKEGGGVDIVSGGELYRALKAGVPPEKIVYSGVGKKIVDMEYALDSGILLFNVESAQELLRLNEVAGRIGKKANVALRVNPDVDPKTHPYISTGLKQNKFGIDIKEAPEQYTIAAASGNLRVRGVSCHIGSQLTQVSPFVDALDKLKNLVNGLGEAGIGLDYLDLGGGLGITYDQEEPPHPADYARAIKGALGISDMTLILEPGRVLVGNAGALVTELEYVKSNIDKTFYIVDAAMNDLMRPSLYKSYHGILPVVNRNGKTLKADIVGPICETGDFLAKERDVPVLEQGDLIAVMSAGAYGFSMSSNYNSRPRACEVMVKDDGFYTIRARETYDDLIRGEAIPDFLMDD